MTDHTPEELAVIAAANQARAELPQTEAVFEGLREAMIKRWVATDPITGGAERESIYMAVRIMDRVQRGLEAAVASGAVADHAAAMRDIIGGESLVV